MELQGRLSDIDQSGKLNNTGLLSNIHWIVRFEILKWSDGFKMWVCRYGNWVWVVWNALCRGTREVIAVMRELYIMDMCPLKGPLCNLWPWKGLLLTVIGRLLHCVRRWMRDFLNLLKTRLFSLFMMLGWNLVSFASLMTHSMSCSLGKRILVSWIWLWFSLLVLCSALQTFLVVYEAEMLVVFFHSGLNWQMVCPVQTWMDWQRILCVPGIFSYGAVKSIVLAWQANTFNFVSWPVSHLYGWGLYGCEAGQQPKSSSKTWVTISGGCRSQYLLARQHSIVY